MRLLARSYNSTPEHNSGIYGNLEEEKKYYFLDKIVGLLDIDAIIGQHLR